MFIPSIGNMESFKLNFENTTSFLCALEVYQDSTVIPSLSRLVWQSCTVSGFVKGNVEWDVTYGVAIVTFNPAICEYIVSQSVHARPGQSYQVIMKNGIIGIVANPTDLPCYPEQIKLANNTKKILDLGMTMGGKLLKVNHNVNGGEILSYTIHSSTNRTFYIDLLQVEVNTDEVDSDTVTPPLQPVKVQFQDHNYAMIKLIEDRGTVQLTDPVNDISVVDHVSSSERLHT